VRDVVPFEVYAPNVPEDLEAAGGLRRRRRALSWLHAHHDPRQRASDVGAFQSEAVRVGA
jgi:hypothetical protein